MPIRYHLDEHISASIAPGLRRRGIDVTRAADVGLTGADDAAQLTFAASAGPVMVTQDTDYLKFHAQSVYHEDIAYCRQGSLPVGEMLRNLTQIHDLLTAKEVTNRVEFL